MAPICRHLRSKGIRRYDSRKTCSASGDVSVSLFISLASLSRREYVAHALIQDTHHLVNLLGRHDQRRPERKPVRIEAAQQPVLQCSPPDPYADLLPRSERLLCRRVPHELDPLQQSLAADVADHAVLLRQPPEAGPQLLATGAGVGTQVAFEDLAQHGEARRARDRVALEGVSLHEAGVLADRSPEHLAYRLTADHRHSGA